MTEVERDILGTVERNRAALALLTDGNTQRDILTLSAYLFSAVLSQTDAQQEAIGAFDELRTYFGVVYPQLVTQSLKENGLEGAGDFIVALPSIKDEVH